MKCQSVCINKLSTDVRLIHKLTGEKTFLGRSHFWGEAIFGEKPLKKIPCPLDPPSKPTVHSTANNAQVVMAAAEVETVGYHFLLNIGRGSEWSPEEFDQVKLHTMIKL